MLYEVITLRRRGHPVPGGVGLEVDQVDPAPIIVGERRRPVREDPDEIRADVVVQEVGSSYNFV